MSINICKAEYGTKIFCSHPCSEFRHISQLLCDDQKLECGYLAESFVRPPVYILICWPDVFKVNKITFKPSYGRHTINRMSIRLLLKRDISTTINESNFKNIIEQFKYNKPDLLINFSLYNKSDTVEINFVEQYAPSKSNNCIYNLIRRNVVLVILEITDMKDTSLPCLSCLKIYSPIKRKPILVTTVQNDGIPKAAEVEKKEIIEEKDEPDDRYPDECIDPLTAELLTHPVKLPCGTYINIGTLRKFWSTKSETAPKCNPFTMVPLNETQIALATVIDEVKQAEVSKKIQEHRQRQEDLYNAIVNPKKRYVPRPCLDSSSESDSDNDERLAAKLSDHFSRNFAFLLNKNP